MALFVAELFIPAFGILTTGGTASLVIGFLILFSHSSLPMQIDRGLMAGVTVAIAAFVIFAVGAAVRGQRRKVATGAEALVGKVAVTKTPLGPQGLVLVDGEHWTAIVDDGQVEPGKEVTITKLEGLKLIVTKKTNRGRRA